MITAKQLNGTYPHRQMRMYIEKKYPDANAYSKGAYLSALVVKFLRNFRDNPHGGMGGGFEGENDIVPRNIDEAFVWEDTPEGHDFWENMHRDNRPEEEQEVVAKKAKGKEPPKKRVGWWV